MAVLFARSGSIYHSFPGVDVFDLARNALNFAGGLPVVSHPPCRLWGRFSQFSTAPESEKSLAHFAVAAVRQNGGVLEHPSYSKLWNAAGLPRPGRFDEFGGFTVSMPQFWFGHRASKCSWFYVCGVRPGDLPQVPFVLGEATHAIASARAGVATRKPQVTKYERDATPPLLAEWLLAVARKCEMGVMA